MENPFVRPEKPIQLTYDKIVELIDKTKANVYCGKCNSIIDQDITGFYLCSCSESIRGTMNNVACLRIVQDKIILDIINIEDSFYDPAIHAPYVGNKKRTKEFINYKS